ncbi:FAD:protein FMN transferase [candidate division KSB1 bacterium]|nr:FAD:protein FMN transferase [candidate division KSB1 bacterium]
MKPNSILRSVIPLALCAALLGMAGCKGKKAESQWPSETRDAFGTKITITVFDPNQKPEMLKRIYDEVYPVLTQFEAKSFKPGPDNQVLGISKGAGEQSIPVDPATFDFLMKAMRFYDYGGQAFDIRYGPMLDAWGFDTKPRVPAKAELDSLQSYVAQGGMFVAGTSILLAKPGMRFDAREIALGYALDLAAKRIAEIGIRSAAISTPSTWRFIGDPPDPKGFPAKIRNPLQADSSWATVFAPVGGLAVKSASDGAFSSGGQAYHRILDPRTGMPANRLAAAIVQSPDAITAQAMAYALMVSGSVDSCDANGKTAVGGAVLVKNAGGKLSEIKSGSLANSFDLAR